jgi:hypothetical protein
VGGSQGGRRALSCKLIRPPDALPANCRVATLLSAACRRADADGTDCRHTPFHETPARCRPLAPPVGADRSQANAQPNWSGGTILGAGSAAAPGLASRRFVGPDGDVRWRPAGDRAPQVVALLAGNGPDGPLAAGARVPALGVANCYLCRSASAAVEGLSTEGRV